MARQQVGYNPGAEALRPTVSPNFQMVQPESVEARLSENKGFQLAAALGAPSVQKAIEQLSANREQVDKQAGAAYANSKTVDELKQEIDSGKLKASHSPIFNATVQHIYGENVQSQFERDTISKLNTGELRFDTPEELEKYLVDGRNQYLEGASTFSIAGFDKRWNQFRESAITAHTKVKDNEAVDRAVAEAQDSLWTVTQNVQDPNFTGSKDEAASIILERYKLLQDASLLRDDQRKEALKGLMSNLVTTGDVELVNSLLNSQLDNGLSVGSILGGAAVTTLKSSVDSFNDRNQRQRVDVEMRPFGLAADAGELKGKKLEEFNAWVTANEKYIPTSTYREILRTQDASERQAQILAQKSALITASERTVNEANQVASSALRNGNYAWLPQLSVLTPEGNVKDFNQKEFAERELPKIVAEKKLDFAQEVQLWSTNSVENPQWKSIIEAGVSNLASVGWTYDGKNVGQLNPQGEAAINQYLQIAAVNEGVANKYAGKDAELLSDIKFMIEKGGYPNISDAAAFINKVRNSGVQMSDAGSIRADVKAAVDEIVNPSWYSSAFNWVSTLFGGNEDVNLMSIQADIRRRSELLIMSGQVSDPQSAIKATVEYYSDPRVTTKINNTIYFNKDLPTVPKGESTSEWMERFIETVPAKVANSQNLDGSRIRLEPGRNGDFTVFVGNVPLTDDKGQIVQYTKKYISSWIGEEWNKELMKYSKPSTKDKPSLFNLKDQPLDVFKY